MGQPDISAQIYYFFKNQTYNKQFQYLIFAAAMNLEFFIASRVASSGNASFSRLIIRLAIIAIALGLSVMIISTSLIRGFKNEISSKIFGFWGHIYIADVNVNRNFEAVPIDIKQDFYKNLDTVRQVRYLDQVSFLGYPIPDRYVERKTRGGIRHIQVTALVPGVINTKDEIEGILLKGIGMDFDWTYMDEYLVEGNRLELADTSNERGMIVSRETADRLGLEVGNKIRVIFVRDNRQVPRRFTVSGIYKTGLEEYDRQFALVDIRDLQEVLQWEPDQVGGFEVFIDDLDDLNAINEYIYLEQLPTGLYSETIRQKLPGIFEWLELQNVNERVILSLVLVVAIINMVTAIMILILERTNMIGILKALGSTNFSVQKIFLYHAAYIIAIGLLIGNFVGILICLIQDRFEIIKLSEADYYLSVAPIELNVWIILALNLAMGLIILLFLVIPSFLVSSITPVRAIRFK